MRSFGFNTPIEAASFASHYGDLSSRTLNCDTLARMRDLFNKERFLPIVEMTHGHSKVNIDTPSACGGVIHIEYQFIRFGQRYKEIIQYLVEGPIIGL